MNYLNHHGLSFATLRAANTQQAQNTKFAPCEKDWTHAHWIQANIGDLSIAVNYLQMIINSPGLEVAIDKDKQCLFFKTGNQSGAIMGLRY